MLLIPECFFRIPWGSCPFAFKKIGEIVDALNADALGDLCEREGFPSRIRTLCLAVRVRIAPCSRRSAHWNARAVNAYAEHRGPAMERDEPPEIVRGKMVARLLHCGRC